MESAENKEIDWHSKYEELRKQYVNLLKIVDDGVFIAIQNIMNLQSIVKQLRQQIESMG